MTYRLTKRFRFESAHRLAKGYTGKCARLHGHSWNGELIVAVEGLDTHDMALDFAILGDMVKGWETKYDHRVFLQQDDPLVHVMKGEEVVVFTRNPTCETLAAMLAESARAEFEGLPISFGILSVAVRIEETCTTSCTFTA